MFQFAGSFTQTRHSLMTAGMTPSQAEVYLSLPAWIGAVFGVGVFGGHTAFALCSVQQRRGRWRRGF